MQTIGLQASRIISTIQHWEHWHEIQLGAEKEYQLSKTEFERLLPEYQKFMGLIALGYQGLGMFSADVDKIWHTHILNTLLYEEFCMLTCGKMIHHVPNLKSKLVSRRSDCSDPDPDCKDPESTCKPELCTSCKQDPDPTCIGRGGSYSDPCNAAEYFCRAYRSTYSDLPGAIWNLPIADGAAR